MNLIADRIAYFLKDIPPYQFLSAENRYHLAEKIHVRYVEEGAVLFEENAPNSGFCYVMRQGVVELRRTENGKERLVDFCESGDTFGVRSILSNQSYVMSAICKEEALVYAIPVDEFQRCLSENQSFALYFASGYASGQAVVRIGKPGALFASNQTEEILFDYPKHVLCCSLETSIKEAAKLMSNKRVGSIIIKDSNEFPLGIVTDKDLRNKVVAEGLSTDIPVNSIMSSPVFTVKPDIKLAEIQTQMLRLGIHHLVVTEDGTTQSKVAGIISDHDVLVQRKDHPAALIKRLKRSSDWAEIVEIRNQTEQIILHHLEQGNDVGFVNSFVNHINDCITKKAIDEFVDEHPTSCDFVWLSLGSEGREEQLLRTDVDNALVFADGGNQAYFLQLAQHVNTRLFECGFYECPADMMATNPKWCKTLSEWKQIFSSWIQAADPKAVMLSTIFFDFRQVHGSLELTNQLKAHVQKEIQREPIFLNYLAKNALQNPPPLGFFKNMVLEHEGDHADTFDIKKRALMPLCDAARLLAFEKGFIESSSTVNRFLAVKSENPSIAALLEEAAKAYEVLLFFRAKTGLKSNSNGRYIPINELSNLEKQQLKQAFRPIKELQEIIEIRFQTAFFN
ncbi:CBS domain-containing protein [bacterium]|nr:MAG: CBS domain-containing protein [bacterium]